MRVKQDKAFAKTRFYAGLMGVASKIGSRVYKELPEDWRQGWMYRSFTGEALKMLKEGKKVEEVLEELVRMYVWPVVKPVMELKRAPVAYNLPFDDFIYVTMPLRHTLLLETG